MNRIDRILDILDGAGQSSRERDVSEPETDVPDGRCWRCTHRDVAEGSSVCAPCRVFLLGDGPDPDAEPPAWRQVVTINGNPFDALLEGDSLHVSLHTAADAGVITPTSYETVRIEDATEFESYLLGLGCPVYRSSQTEPE